MESEWEAMSHQLLEIRDGIAPVHFNEQHFSEHTDILSALRAKNEKWLAIRCKLSELAGEAGAVIDEWYTEKDVADWMQALKADIKQYESLSTQLEQQNIDPAEYPRLLMQRKNKQKELNLISEYQAHQEELEAEKREVFRQIEENRTPLSEKRQKFLTGVLQANPFVSIKVKPFGENWEGIEPELRRILQCPDHFDRDIEALKAIYHENGDDKIEKLKEAVKGIRNGGRLPKMNGSPAFESVAARIYDRSILWFPRR